MKTWKYFIPLIGFVFYVIDGYRGVNDFDYWDARAKNWQFGGPLPTDDLTMLFIGACFVVHIPSAVGLGFVLINTFTK